MNEIRTRAALAAAVLATLCGTTLQAQPLASRIAASGDGTVLVRFPARDGVCGWHESGATQRTGSITIHADGVYQTRGGDCRGEVARLTLGLGSGVVTAAAVAVGRDPATEGRVTDLGAASGAEVAAYVLEAAHRAPVEAGRKLVVAAAIADGAVVHPGLLRLAGSETVPQKTREQAVFWAAERGASVSKLSALYAQTQNEKVRNQILFAYSRSSDPAAAQELVRVARAPGAVANRKTALFWLSQVAGRAATRDLDEVVADRGVETEVRKQAIFALSRRPADEGIPALIRIARESPNPELRKQAIFWLGRSGDARALALLEELVR